MLLLLLPLVVEAQVVSVRGVRVWTAPDNTRLVFDVSGPVEHTLFLLKDPARLVIDIKDTRLADSLSGFDLHNSLIKDMRSAERNGHDLRVVLDLTGPVRPQSFLLRPNAEYGHRLVIDLFQPGADTVAKTESAPPISAAGKPRPIIIAIDAGHGGEDPGAIGPDGIKEKNVTLAIARKLDALVSRTPGMKAVMTRSGDYYVSLGRRVQIAREHHADLFIAIHADACPGDSHARGASVYTLSARGASSEQARLLANRENSSDIIGGVNLDDKSDLLASVLLDLSLTGTIAASNEVAQQVLAQLRHVGPLHLGRVEEAGFRVLKDPNVPSILVETAYITNRREERQLVNPQHQMKLARAIFQGAVAYLHQNPPPGTLLAMQRNRRQQLALQQNRQQRHVISRGETLSAIARQYQVSVEALRTTNDIKGDDLYVGEILTIPSSSES